MSSDTDRLVNLLLQRTSADENAVREDVRRLKQYGIDDESVLKTLTMKYGDAPSLSLLDVPAVTLVRAGLLVSHGIQGPRALATADPNRVTDAILGSRSLAEALVEAAAIVHDDSSALDTLREETDVSDRQIVDVLRPLVTDGIPPSEAVHDVTEILNREPSVLDVCELNPRAVYKLHQAGYETVDDIAAASVDDLRRVEDVEEQSPERAIKAARRESTRSAPEDRGDQLSTSGGEPTMGNSPDDTTDGTGGEDGSYQLRLLLVGSARPNLEDGEVAGIRIRAALENRDFELSSFDAVVYSGFTSPTPHHERLGPESCFEELHDQLGALASQLPAYYITGNFGHGDPLKTLYESDTYTHGPAPDPFATAQSDTLRYIPVQRSIPLGDVHITQNPALASAQQNCILVTPDLYPAIWNDHDALAYVAGGQLPGRLIEDSIAPMFALENIGPKRPDAAGGVHVITLTDSGINSHELVSLGDVDLRSCPDHIDRGLQFTPEDNGCIFCYNEARYFEEWLESVTQSGRSTSVASGVAEIADLVVEKANFTDDEAEDFREYLSNRITDDYIGQSRGPRAEGRRRPDSPLLPDPRDVYDEATLVASESLRIPPHERAAYFRRFGVEAPETVLQAPFDEVAPPIPQGMASAHADLDEAAHDRDLLGGEWLFFPKRQTIGSIWTRTLELVDDGRLYDAQVGTAWHHEARTSRSRRYYLAVAVPNYFDVDDVRRVAELITTEDIIEDEQVFFFKPLLYTRLAIHDRNAPDYGLSSSTRYTLSALRELSTD